MDNKLSVHFGEDKAESILFSRPRGLGEGYISLVCHSINSSFYVKWSITGKA